MLLAHPLQNLRGYTNNLYFGLPITMFKSTIGSKIFDNVFEISNDRKDKEPVTHHLRHLKYYVAKAS